MSDDQARVNAAYQEYLDSADWVANTHQLVPRLWCNYHWLAYERARLETGLEITQ